MYSDIAQWHHIRQRIREEGAPKRQISRDTGISRHMINKMLTHERPPGYGPRPPHYPKLGPYITAIDQLLDQPGSTAPVADITIQNIVESLRLLDGFSGSYDSVRRYIRRRTGTEVSTWEQAYDLVLKLPKARAVDFIRLLSRSDPPDLTSRRLRPFMREVACPCKQRPRPTRERQRRADIEWMRQMLQNERGNTDLHRDFGRLSDLCDLLKHLRDGSLRERNRAMVALASHRKIPTQTICGFLGVG